VINTHDTVPARKRQTLRELKVLAFKLEKNMIEIMRLNNEITQNENRKGKEGSDNYELAIKIDENKLVIRELEFLLLGIMQEINSLLEIASQYPKFTQEQYEADEVNYWMLRLGRQVMEDIKTMGRPSIANMDAIRMMEVPQNDDFASWLKSFSEPLNSPQDFIKGVVMARLEQQMMAQGLQQEPQSRQDSSGDGVPQPEGKKIKVQKPKDQKVAFSKPKEKDEKR